MRLGILSDTHDLLRSELLDELRTCDHILHAGDICSPEILQTLEQIAPTDAVRGNADKENMDFLPPVLDTRIGDLHVLMTHKKKDLPEDLSGYDLVVVGHSHQYSEKRTDTALLLNPGSCGPRRFHQPITFAVAEVDGKTIQLRRIDVAHPEEKHPDTDMKLMIETVVKEQGKGRGYQEIAQKHGYDPMLVEQIIRLYVTHPGVTTEGIMTKMGI